MQEKVSTPQEIADQTIQEHSTNSSRRADFDAPKKGLFGKNKENQSAEQALLDDETEARLVNANVDTHLAVPAQLAETATKALKLGRQQVFDEQHQAKNAEKAVEKSEIETALDDLKSTIDTKIVGAVVAGKSKAEKTTNTETTVSVRLASSGKSEADTEISKFGPGSAHWLVGINYEAEAEKPTFDIDTLNEYELKRVLEESLNGSKGLDLVVKSEKLLVYPTHASDAMVMERTALVGVECHSDEESNRLAEAGIGDFRVGLDVTPDSIAALTERVESSEPVDFGNKRIRF